MIDSMCGCRTMPCAYRNYLQRTAIAVQCFPTHAIDCRRPLQPPTECTCQVLPTLGRHSRPRLRIRPTTTGGSRWLPTMSSEARRAGVAPPPGRLSVHARRIPPLRNTRRRSRAARLRESCATPCGKTAAATGRHAVWHINDSKCRRRGASNWRDTTATVAADITV